MPYMDSPVMQAQFLNLFSNTKVEDCCHISDLFYEDYYVLWP
jgi:hypothetical protein